MSNKAASEADGCTAAGGGCGDPGIDVGGLCEWHRLSRQRIELALAMLNEAQRRLAQIGEEGLSAATGRGRVVDAGWSTLDKIARFMEAVMPARVKLTSQQGRLLSAVLRSAEMRRLIRSQPRPANELPRWMPTPGPSYATPAMAAAVALAVRDMPDRPLRSAGVAAAVRDLRVVRDPDGWMPAEVLDAMVEHLNSPLAAAA